MHSIHSHDKRVKHGAVLAVSDSVSQGKLATHTHRHTPPSPVGLRVNKVTLCPLRESDSDKTEMEGGGGGGE